MPILVWAQSVNSMFNSTILTIWQVKDTCWSDFKCGLPRMLYTAHFHFHNLDFFSIFHFVLLHDWIPIVYMVLVCLSINCSHQPLWDCISFSSCPENRATNKASFSWLRVTSHSGTVHFLFMENKLYKCKKCLFTSLLWRMVSSSVTSFAHLYQLECFNKKLIISCYEMYVNCIIQNHFL